MRFQTDSNRKGLNLPHVSSCCEIQISWPKNIEIARHSSHWLFFQFSELQFVFLSQHFFFVHIHFHPVRTICSKSVQTRLGPKSCQELCIFWADLPPPPREPQENLWRQANMVWFVKTQIRLLSPATQAKLNMPSSWHHWNHLPGDSADKCQNQLQRAFPQAACFFSSCWMSRLERPQGVNSHQLHKRSYTTIIFPPGREASKSTGWNLVLNTKHGQLAGSQQISLKKVRWCAFLRFPRMLSDNMQLHYLTYGDSSLPVQVSCMWSMQTNACILMVSVISHSGVSTLVLSSVFFCICVLLFASNLHVGFTYIYHVASVKTVSFSMTVGGLSFNFKVCLHVLGAIAHSKRLTQLKVPPKNKKKLLDDCSW